MARSRKKRRATVDVGGGANWMDTYGDLVTLLLCFFVLLFAMSSIDAAKWDQIATSFSGVPAIQVIPMDMSEAMAKPITMIPTTQGDPTPTPAMPQVEDPISVVDEILQILYENMSAHFQDTGIVVELIPDHVNSLLTVRFNDSVFFNSAQADLLPGSEVILSELVELFAANAQYINLIDIQGHTDNVPINTPRFPDNWALSGARASSALRYILESEQILPEKLYYGGYGEYHPVASNDTVEGRAKNRRVDFVIEAKKTLSPVDNPHAK
jgi:chemotaxis protein MotB